MELPTPEELEYNGKTYRLLPLGLADLVEQAKWLRDQHISEAKRQMVGLPEPLAKHAWTEARAEAAKIKLGTEEYRDATLERDGLAHALWLAWGKIDSAVTMATMYDVLRVTKYEGYRVVAMLLGMIAPDPKQPGGPAQTGNQ